MDIVPENGVGPIKFGMAVDDVKRILGEPDHLPGRSLSYSRLGLAVVPSGPDGTVVAVFMGGSGGLADRFTGRTKEGVKLKSTRQEVVTGYGPPEYAVTDADGTEHLKYDSRKLEFTLRDGKVFWMAAKR